MTSSCGDSHLVDWWSGFKCWVICLLLLGCHSFPLSNKHSTITISTKGRRLREAVGRQKCSSHIQTSCLRLYVCPSWFPAWVWSPSERPGIVTFQVLIGSSLRSWCKLFADLALAQLEAPKPQCWLLLCSYQDCLGPRPLLLTSHFIVAKRQATDLLRWNCTSSAFAWEWSTLSLHLGPYVG